MAEESDKFGNPQQAGEAQAPGDEARASLQADLSAMQMLLRRTGQAWRRPILVEGALWYLVTLCAVALSALMVAAIIPAAQPGVTGWMLLVGSGAASLGALVAWLGFRHVARDPVEVARRLQREHPAFRNDIVAALEFAQKLLDTPDEETLGFSRQMARLHVERTARLMLQKCEHNHLANLLIRRELNAPAMSLAGCLALLLLPAILAPGWTFAVLTSPLAGVTLDETTHVVHRPIVGGLNIYYTPPGYTGLGRTVDPQSSGYIEALVGSEVRVEATPLIQNAERIELVMRTVDDASAAGATEKGTADKAATQKDKTKAHKDAPATDATQPTVLVMHEHEPEPDLFATSFGLGTRTLLRTSFVALAPGTYHFRAIMPDGTVVEEAGERQIHLLADQAPEVGTPTHAGEVDVSPDDVLDIGFSVSDDFGIESVWQVWHFAGDPERATRTRVDLPQLVNAPREVSGTIQLDLRPLSLQPKDEVVFYFEAIDNNSMSGPGVGKSKPLVLRVASPQDTHHQNLEAQQAIFDAMVDLLIGYLENPMSPRQVKKDGQWVQTVTSTRDPTELHARYQKLALLQAPLQQLVGAMEKLADALKKDPLVVERNLTLFTSLHTQFKALTDEGTRVFERAQRAAQPPTLTPTAAQPVATYAAKSEDTLERSIFRLGELIASARMAAVQASVEEIKELKERLKTLLEQYQKTQDPELKQAILRDVQRLRQRMNELMARMRSQLQELPREHMNMDAIKQQALESETNKMTDSLSQIEDLLANDDIDGALKALEELENSLDSLSEDMDEQFGEAQPQGLSELDKKVDKLMNELNDVRQAEKQLEADTSQFNKEQADQRREQVEKMLEQFTRQMLEKLSEQERALQKMAAEASEMPHLQRIQMNLQAMQDLKKMLEDKDIAMSLERAEQALRATQETRYSLELSRRYSDSDAQRKQIDQLRAQNDQVARRGQQIVDEIDQLLDHAQQKFNQMGSQQMQELAERQQQINEQAGRLEQNINEAGGQFPELKQQLGPTMQQARQAMQDARQSLEGQQIQQGLDQERQALDQLGKLQQQMKDVVKKQRQGNREGSGRSAPREKVTIPGEDHKRAGQQLRQDVMDAMKQEKLQRYESEIERYYKSIVE